MNIIISSNIFAAAALFRGMDDIRYYLNGLYLETGANGARLVGCDGHQLAVARLEGCYPESSIILPGSLAAAVKPRTKAPQDVVLEFEEGHQQFEDQENVRGVFVPRDITLTVGDLSTTARELEGKFPDYRRVVPKETDGATAQFDPGLVNRINKACSILGCKFFVGIAYNGDSSGLSVIDENFVVVTMPFKADPSKTSPSWVQESLNEPEPARLAA